MTDPRPVRRFRIGPLAALVALACAAHAHATVRQVPAQYPSVQAAIDVAADGDVIVVSPGNHLGGIDFLGKAIVVRSVDPSDPDIVAATVIHANGDAAAAALVSGEGPQSELSGLTLTGGYFPGGGIQTYGSQPTIVNCRCVENSGAGMINLDSSPTVLGCRFESNDRGMHNTGASPAITGCTFVSNYDGGMMNVASSPSIVDCEFSTNTAGLGGGMWNDFDSNPLVKGCVFDGNAAQASGGGMFNDGSPTVVDCVFTENSAGFGGAMANGSRSHVSVAGSSFCGNEPEQIGGPWTDKGGNTFDVLCGPLGDLTGDGVVNSADLAILLGQWGFGGSADLTGDGVVNAADLSVLLGNWS